MCESNNKCDLLPANKKIVHDLKDFINFNICYYTKLKIAT